MRFKEEWGLTGKQGRDIYSQAWSTSLVEKPELDTGKWKNWESRYLDPKVLDLEIQMDIYNDVVAIYNWYEGEVFGVQVINEKAAKLQKQLFDVVWEKAK